MPIASSHPLPPTLPDASPVGNGLALKRDPLAFFARLAREAGDVAHYELESGVVYFLNDPALIREVLHTREKAFRKWAFNSGHGRIFGTGLNGSEDPLHRRMQTIMRPAFRPRSLADYAQEMSALTEEAQRDWAEGSLELSRELTLLTLEIVARTLFSVSLRDAAAGIMTATETLQRYSSRLGSAADDDRAFDAANDRLTAVCHELIERRRRAQEPDESLLALLLAAQGAEDETTARFVSDEQIVQELRTFLLAGHVTTAYTLAAAFSRLGRHPEIEEALHRQLDATLGETDRRLPGAGDLAALEICEHIFLETLRLHPPVWVLGREALDEVTLGEGDGAVTLPAGARLVIVPWLLHRDARWFPEPDRFLPARWAGDGARARLPRGAFLPFSTGSRSCIGERFAMLQGTLLLATLAQRWTFRDLRPTPHDPGWSPQIILWPRRGVRLDARRRPLPHSPFRPTHERSR